MPQDENDESISDEDSQTEYHIYHEDSTDTESIDSENSTFEVNDESTQPILSEIMSAEPTEASQSVHLEDNITLRGDDDQPQTEPEEQLGRGHRDRRLPTKLDNYVLSNNSEDYGLLSYQQVISREEKSEWKEAIEEEKESKPQQRHKKYMGAWLDTKITFDGHMENVHREKCLTVSTNILPNNGTPKSFKRKVLANVIYSELILARLVWYMEMKTE
ncbi:hypothetical protein JTB14_003210 [Gonioctena quinquepunctata]|nr:hypothetical protein JTB14_003210 [Gonioctena quinquepunctata]